MTNATITRKIVLKRTVADCRRELRIAELKFRVAELEVTIVELTSDMTGFTDPNFRGLVPSPWLAALDNADRASEAVSRAKDVLELVLMSQPFKS